MQQLCYDLDSAQCLTGNIICTEMIRLLSLSVKIKFINATSLGKFLYLTDNIAWGKVLCQ